MQAMNWFAFALVLLALVLGVALELSGKWRDLAGWAIIATSAAIIIDLATKWAHTVHLG